MKNLHPIAQAVLGGLVAALSTAIPLVDNGTTVAEILSICLAALVGTGLTAVVPNSRQPASDATD